MRDPKQHPIDHLFAENLREARVKAPDKVWNGISNALETNRLRRKVFYARMTAAASLALLLGFGAWYYFIGGNLSPRTIVLDHGFAHVHTLPATKVAECEVPCEMLAQADLIKASAPGRLPEFNPASSKFKQLVGKVMATQTVTLMLPSKVIDQTSRGLGDPSADLGQAPSPWLMMNMELKFPDPVPSMLEPNEEFMAEFSPRNDDDASRRDHNFSLGGTAAPDFAFASQTPVALGKVNTSSKNALPADATNAMRSYTPVVAFTSGLNFGYEVSKRISMNTGLFYTERKSDKEHAILENGLAEAVQTNFDVSFLEIPASMRYKVIAKEKWSSYVSTGVSSSLFLRYNNSFESESGINARKVSDKSDAFTLAQTNLLLSAGVDLKLHDRVSLNVEPKFRYGIYTNDYAFSLKHPVSLAAFSGISYKF